jgi:outer membrane protein assembly factor BamB
MFGPIAGNVRTCAVLLVTLIAGMRCLAAETALPAETHRPQTLDLLSRLWSVPLFPDDESFPAPRSRLATVVPSVAGEVVFINDAQGVRGIDLRSGRSAWPIGDDDTGFLIAPNDLPTTGSASANRDIPACWGGLIAEGRWFGGIVGAKSPRLPPRPDMLVCLELAAQGRLEWFRQVSRERGANPASSISGRPVASADSMQIYFPLSHPNGESSVLCLSPRGEVLWQSEPSKESFRTNASSFGTTLVQSAGKVFLNDRDQRVVAFGGGTGKTDWERTFPVQAGHVRTRAGSHSLAISEDRVIAQTNHGLTALDCETGRPVWINEGNRIEGSLLGVREGIAVVAGDWLWGMDARTGKIVWQTGFNRDGLRTAGQGLFLQGTVLWPTEHELWTVDTATGRVRQRLSLASRAGTGGGNLAISDQTLLIAEPARLTAYNIRIR